MKFLLTTAAAATIAFAVPALAQATGQGAPILQAGSTSQNNPAVTGVAVPGGHAMNSNPPAQNGTSASDNTQGNNSANSADNSPNGAPIPSMSNGSSTDGTTASGPASGTAVTSGATIGR